MAKDQSDKSGQKPSKEGSVRQDSATPSKKGGMLHDHATVKRIEKGVTDWQKPPRPKGK